MPRLTVKEDASFELKKPKNTEKGHYNFISYEMRIQLIDKIKNEGYSILRAAKSLNIKPSTAKYIYKCYKTEGKIMKKPSKDSSSQEGVEEEKKVKQEFVEEENEPEKLEGDGKSSNNTINQMNSQKQSYELNTHISYQIPFWNYQYGQGNQNFGYHNYFPSFQFLPYNY